MLTVQKSKYLFFTFLLVVFFSLQVNAQSDLQSLLKQAEENYPLLKAKAMDFNAAKKGLNASKSTLIPTLDASYQANYATYNNITGMFYPQFLLPISGPPSPGNNSNGIYGSAASLLLNWQPITFGQRLAQIDYSKAGVQYASADAQNEIFQHKIKVVNAYLDALTANELVKVYEKNYLRAETNYSTTKTLVLNGIKPGVDSALFKAEISRAKIDLLNSQKYKQQTLISLSQLIVSDQVSASDTTFFNKLPSLSLSTDSVKHPLLSLYNSNIELSNARKKMLNRSLLPTLGIWGTTYARGSGIQYNGTANSMEGLSFQRYNYGVGMQLSVPLLQYGRVRPLLQQQDFAINSNQEKLNEVTLQLKKQLQIADTTLNNAYLVAKESPVLAGSADFAYKALLSRYQSGLANYADLMHAQYFLIKAETENKTSYVAVWKALLYKAAVKGDINIFLNEVTKK